MKIVSVPEIFITRTNHIYPPGNDVIFEEFFYKKLVESNIDTDLYYLPILWTNFYISRNYANDDMSDLQLFLDNLPRDRKYFTIVQYDDGIVHNVKDLDILIFSSGGVGDYPIPLINKPYVKMERSRDIFSSFVGTLNGRHRLREEMNSLLLGKPDYLISENLGFDKFKEIMERSIFSLCPRGYGKTSFRINESLNLGSIPVYIFDDPWIPFKDEIEFSEYGILIDNVSLPSIDNILKSVTDSRIKKLQENGRYIYENYFSYESCFTRIIKKINK